MTGDGIGVVGLLRRSTVVQAVLLGMVVVLSLATVFAFRAADQRARSTERTLFNYEVLRSEVLSAETGLRGYLLVEDQSFLDPYREAAPRIAAAMATLTDTVDAEDRADLEAVGDLASEWRRAFAEPILRDLRDGRPEAAQALIESGQGKARIDAIRVRLANLEADARAEVADRRRIADRVAVVGGALAVAAVAATVVNTVRSRRRMTNFVAEPLVALAATAARFGAGDLAARADATGVVEVERLGRAFNQMAERTEVTVSELRALDQMKSEFVSVVSHELRTPLTSIRGSLGLLASGAMGELPDDAREMLGIAMSNTDRLVRLINDILDLERIEAGEQALHIQPWAVALLMEDAAGNVAGSAGAAGVRIDVRPVTATVHADGDRVVQALTNLLGNAVKFSDPGSPVVLDGELRDGEVVLRVTDEGRGIPHDRQEAIFERFQQVDASDAREKGGTGLGLAIVRSVAERHGGRVELASEPGGGSCFSLVLPLVPVPC